PPFSLRGGGLPFPTRHSASLRAIYDLADLDRSRFMHSTGQSGNFLSPWYSSFAERWAKVEYVTIPARREKIEAAQRRGRKPYATSDSRCACTRGSRRRRAS